MALYGQVVGQKKVNGAAYPGLWVEKQIVFVKITFSADISAIPAANLVELGTTTPVSAGTVANGVFGVVESALVYALETLETDATVLAVSQYNTTTFSVDVMLGYATAWFSNSSGLIASGLPVGVAGGTLAEAQITTAGSAPVDAVGALVNIVAGAYTFSLQWAYMDGSMPVPTSATVGAGFSNGLGAYTLPILDFVADGATSGTAAQPMGGSGYYPADPFTA